MIDHVPGHTAEPAGESTYARRLRVRPLAAAMVGLRCAAALLMLLAVNSFVRGLGQLFFFFGGMLFYGPAAVELENFDYRLGRVTWALVGPLLFGAAGGLCLAGAKRMRARLNLAPQPEGRQAPVVYLRSFQIDKRLSRRPLVIGRVFSFHTEEEQFVAALRESGPVVAIGRPGERLPRLGAQRVYVEDAEWRQQVLSWFTRAALVVIHIPPTLTEGLLWEIEESLNSVALHRLVLLVPRDVSFLDWLNRKLRDRALAELQLKTDRRSPYGSPIGGIVHFVNGQAEFVALAKPPFFRRPFFSPLVPVYRRALQPVTMRITGTWRPLAPAYGDAAIATLWLAFSIAVIAVAVDLRRTRPFERAIVLCGHRLEPHLPAEALQHARNGDQAAVTAWLQSRTETGLRYLPDDVVLAQAAVLRRFLAIALPAACVELAEGAMGQPALDRIFNEVGKQDPAMLETWCDGRERALVESLKSQHAEAFPISATDVIAAFGVLIEDLSERDQTRFAHIVDNIEASSAENRCWFVQVLHQGIERLQEPSRSTLARVALGQDVEP
jgi:hypothetical protein